LFHTNYGLLVQPEDSYALELVLFQGKLCRSSTSHLKNMSLVPVSCGEILLVEFIGNLSFT